MSKQSHTPGPWFVNGRESYTKYVEARIGGGLLQEVAACGPTEQQEQQEANARLIAAAPDLLEALENLMAAYSQPEDRICCNGVDCGCMGATTYQQAEHYARAAIAKATA